MVAGCWRFCWNSCSVLRRRDNLLIRHALYGHAVLPNSPPWTSRGGIRRSPPYSILDPESTGVAGPLGAWGAHLLASLTMLEFEALCRAV